DSLELEHVLHAGKENGHLKQTYEQFVTRGIARQYIRPAIERLIARGLLKVTHQGGYRGAGRLDPSTYQLTYLQWKFVPATGAPQFMEPTNEWKSYAGTQPPRISQPFNGIKKPNGHDPLPPDNARTGTATERNRMRERERYLAAHTPTYGLQRATERWAAYEQLILGKYGGESLDDAWKARDYAHRPTL